MCINRSGSPAPSSKTTRGDERGSQGTATCSRKFQGALGSRASLRSITESSMPEAGPDRASPLICSPKVTSEPRVAGPSVTTKMSRSLTWASHPPSAAEPCRYTPTRAGPRHTSAQVATAWADANHSGAWGAAYGSCAGPSNTFTPAFSPRTRPHMLEFGVVTRAQLLPLSAAQAQSSQRVIGSRRRAYLNSGRSPADDVARSPVAVKPAFS